MEDYVYGLIIALVVSCGFNVYALYYSFKVHGWKKAVVTNYLKTELNHAMEKQDLAKIKEQKEFENEMKAIENYEQWK